MPCATSWLALQVPLVRAPSTPFLLPVQIGNIYQQFSSPEVGPFVLITSCFAHPFCLKTNLLLVIEGWGGAQHHQAQCPPAAGARWAKCFSAHYPTCIWFGPVLRSMQLAVLDTHVGARAQVGHVEPGPTTAAEWQRSLHSLRGASKYGTLTTSQDKTEGCLGIPLR